MIYLVGMPPTDMEIYLGKDLIDLMATTPNDGPPSWADTVFMKELDPGESQTYNGLYVEDGLLDLSTGYRH